MFPERSVHNMLYITHYFTVEVVQETLLFLWYEKSMSITNKHLGKYKTTLCIKVKSIFVKTWTKDNHFNLMIYSLVCTLPMTITFMANRTCYS